MENRNRNKTPRKIIICLAVVVPTIIATMCALFYFFGKRNTKAAKVKSLAASIGACTPARPNANDRTRIYRSMFENTATRTSNNQREGGFTHNEFEVEGNSESDYNSCDLDFENPNNASAINSDHFVKSALNAMERNSLFEFIYRIEGGISGRREALKKVYHNHTNYPSLAKIQNWDLETVKKLNEFIMQNTYEPQTLNSGELDATNSKRTHPILQEIFWSLKQNYRKSATYTPKDRMLPILTNDSTAPEVIKNINPSVFAAVNALFAIPEIFNDLVSLDIEKSIQIHRNACVNMLKPNNLGFFTASGDTIYLVFLFLSNIANSYTNSYMGSLGTALYVEKMQALEKTFKERVEFTGSQNQSNLPKFNVDNPTHVYLFLYECMAKMYQGLPLSLDGVRVEGKSVVCMEEYLEVRVITNNSNDMAVATEVVPIEENVFGELEIESEYRVDMQPIYYIDNEEQVRKPFSVPKHIQMSCRFIVECIESIWNVSVLNMYLFSINPQTGEMKREDWLIEYYHGPTPTRVLVFYHIKENSITIPNIDKLIMTQFQPGENAALGPNMLRLPLFLNSMMYMSLTSITPYSSDRPTSQIYSESPNRIIDFGSARPQVFKPTKSNGQVYYPQLVIDISENAARSDVDLVLAHISSCVVKSTNGHKTRISWFVRKVNPGQYSNIVLPSAFKEDKGKITIKDLEKKNAYGNIPIACIKRCTKGTNARSFSVTVSENYTDVRDRKAYKTNAPYNSVITQIKNIEEESPLDENHWDPICIVTGPSKYQQRAHIGIKGALLDFLANVSE
ncbi:uncharacterized protein NEMAJ01_0029 [Nematocida major]|uniref:uncharacterized protein n=1 Tax=Nematocida major TaxID=1912982 RepID=UPI0020083C6A|nr:uncharacterized protein NEMAJ01_0029 [Nematocida major]KAH9385133.1 hypothetical protein NEMAJ01_0029 [Nematocida major]